LFSAPNKFAGIEGEFEIGENGVVKISANNPANEGSTLKFDFRKKKRDDKTKKILTTGVLLLILFVIINRNKET
jgi:hypothetical protein